MKPADSPPGAIPAPGAKTFLGWVASSVSRKHLTIVAAAICSLAAGIVAVKLILPQDDFKPETVTTQAVAPEAAWPEHKPIVPPGAPTLTVEPSKPGDFIAQTNLTVPQGLSNANGVTIPPPPERVLIPTAPRTGDRTGTGGTSGAGLGGPVAPTRPGTEKLTIPEPDSLLGPIVPAGGPPAGGGKRHDLVAGDSAHRGNAPGPANHSRTVDLEARADDSRPRRSGFAEAARAIVGRPPSSPSVPPPPDSLIPQIGSGPATPPGSAIAPPLEVKPAPPTLPSGSGAHIEFIKPAESGTVTPAGGRCVRRRLPTTWTSTTRRPTTPGRRSAASITTT